jgi:hypothetical protein
VRWFPKKGAKSESAKQGKTFLRELEDFFVNYHELSGQQYRVLDAKGPKRARKRIEDGETCDSLRAEFDDHRLRGLPKLFA